MGETRTAPRFTKTEARKLYKRADAAGKAAADAARPTPMIVYEPGDPVKSLLGQDDGGLAEARKVYEPVMDGVCGFAWVTVRPGNSSFARWLKANADARPAYRGGMELWVHDYNQSMTRKEAYAQAFADVLREAGVTAYAGSRMD
jgi:hypothetical protein